MPDEWGAAVLGILGIIAGIAYLYGHRHGRAAQFEIQEKRRDKGIMY